MSFSPSSFPALRVYIVRHGETDENRAGIIQGQMDTVLNEDGLIQAHLCGQALKDVKFDRAYSSDLKRALQTTDIIMSSHPNAQIYSTELLRERYMGELQGVKIGQYDKNKLPKSVETGKKFAERTIGFWIYTIEQLIPTIPIMSRPYNVLVVSHGAFISTLCRELVVSQRVEPITTMTMGRCFNTSITTIAMRRDRRGTLEKFAEINHLVNLEPVVLTNADEIQEQEQRVQI